MQIPFNVDEINLIYLSVWRADENGNVCKLICHTSAGKGQRYKADNKLHLEENKCSVRGNVCGIDRHHQKTENCRV